MLAQSYKFICPLGNPVTISISDNIYVEEHGVVKTIPADFKVSFKDFERCGDYLKLGNLKIKRTTAYAIQAFKAYMYATIMRTELLSTLTVTDLDPNMKKRMIRKHDVEFFNMQNLYVFNVNGKAVKITQSVLEVLDLMPSFYSQGKLVTEQEEWFIDSYCTVTTPTGSTIKHVNGVLSIDNLRIGKELEYMRKELEL